MKKLQSLQREESLAKAASSIFNRESKMGTEAARGAGVIMRPCCILFIWPV